MKDFLSSWNVTFNWEERLGSQKQFVLYVSDRSVKILDECGLMLTDDERRAIRWHMGGHHPHDEKDLEDIRIARQSQLWRVIHNADRWDASGKNLH